MPIKNESVYKGKNSLRPNPTTADPARGDHAYLQEPILVGHFGGWGASPTVVNGLPTPNPKPGGLGLHDCPE